MLWSLYYYIIALGKKLVPNKMCVVFFFPTSYYPLQFVSILFPGALIKRSNKSTLVKGERFTWLTISNFSQSLWESAGGRNLNPQSEVEVE